MSDKKQVKPKAWVVAVDMGYGHQRPASSIKHLAYKNQIITANSYRGIPARDRKIWEESRKFYEFISIFKKTPIIGKKVFEIYDRLQEIPRFYPRRDLSKSNFQLNQIYRLMEKGDWGRHLIEKMAKKPLPLVTTFFIPALMADFFNYPGKIYCLATDSDISRTWVPKNPLISKINYLAPSYRVVERLKLYGVPDDRIFFTGFPLPLENMGNQRLDILKKDIAQRLVNLDPKKIYWQYHDSIIQDQLGIKSLPKKSNHLLTVTFAVGGAGAQRDIGVKILNSLKQDISKKNIRLVLVAGIHNSLNSFFNRAVKAAGLKKELGRGVKIIFAGNKQDYFKKFNSALRTTDILWTKPSELSFYAALGLPIIIAPVIGSQELFNRKWLRTIGCAVNQYNPIHTNEWLFDWVNSGWFAEAAMEGFIEAPKFGTYNIEKVISNKFKKETKPTMTLQY